MFQTSDKSDFWSGMPPLQLECFNRAVEFALQTKKIELAQDMKVTVDNNALYPDWSNRDDINAKLKVTYPTATRLRLPASSQRWGLQERAGSGEEL